MGPRALQTASVVRAAARRSQCLSFEKSCSIGFRSGEYLGRKRRRAPAARMARRTALLLCEPRLSMTTMSPCRRVGTRTFVDVEPEGLAIDRPVEEPWR